MKFKVGDKVRVKKELISGKEYGSFSFVKTMEEHMGKMVTIYGTNPQAGAYDITEDGGNAYWTDEMLEPIEDPLPSMSEQVNADENEEVGQDEET